MEQENPIRKIIDGISINTDTAYCFHAKRSIMTENKNGTTKHIQVIQGLYQNPEGKYFLAFWNKPHWDENELNYSYTDDASIINEDQAKKWIRTNCPERMDSFIKITTREEKQYEMQNLTIRITTDLKNELLFITKLGTKSLNKLCIDLITQGIETNNARTLTNLPAPNKIFMPDGRPALDAFEKALEFKNEDEKELAIYAENLYAYWHFNYQHLLPFIASAAYNLINIKNNKENALCFLKWISELHRPPALNAELHRSNYSLSDNAAKK